MISPDPVYQMCRMVRNARLYDDEGLPWIECDRGHYEYEAGHWWWKGWSMKR